MIISDNNIASTERPCWQSNHSAQIIAKLSVDGDDIWCVGKFHIAMDREPIAKTSRLGRAISHPALLLFYPIDAYRADKTTQPLTMQRGFVIQLCKGCLIVGCH